MFLEQLLGRKVGMTQLFESSGDLRPVTAISFQKLYLLQVKSPEKDGYAAVQVGIPRTAYLNEEFSEDWLKHKKKYFTVIRELRVKDGADLGSLKPGRLLSIDDLGLEVGAKISVTAKSKGKGFQGVVKRWGFGGGPASHGSNFHKIPGSVGGARSCGRIKKGQRMPGRMGGKTVTVVGLRVVRVDKDLGAVFVSGAVPGFYKSPVLLTLR